MGESKSVLLLGGKNTNVDESFEWDYELTPNIHEPDIIIIDLTTLTQQVLANNTKKYEELTQLLFNKFINHGFIIFITNPKISSSGYILSNSATNYFLSPIEFETIETAPGKKMNYDPSHPFKNYLQSVETFSFHLNLKRMSSIFERIVGSNRYSGLMLYQINTESRKNAHNNIYNNYRIETIGGSLATDNSSNILSVGYQIEVYQIESGTNGKTGKVFYLPPSTLPNSEYINLLLTDLGVSQVQEIFPDWVHQVKIPGLDKVQKEMDGLINRQNALTNLISVTQKRKERLERYYNLLVSYGSILESTVYDAFKELGFTDLNNDRGKGNEDWRFEFNTKSEIKYGVIEVHGTEGNIGLEKINQCKKWVDDYAINFGEEAKGIFIVNQFRLDKYPESINKRKEFHPDHIKFAKGRNICILPSSILFSWVNSKLALKNITRAKIEKVLLKTNGLVAE